MDFFFFFGNDIFFKKFNIEFNEIIWIFKKNLKNIPKIFPKNQSQKQS
jgi:hypothetical protein